MGGRGSTRWRDHDRKPLVESALRIDLLEPAWKAALSQPRAAGRIEWSDTSTGAPIAWADFHLGTVSEDGSRTLVLRRAGPCSEPQVIRLEAVTVGFSDRHYAMCPAACGRRARKLYEVPGKLDFACRVCAGLQYRSAQRHDPRVDACRRDPNRWMDGRRHLDGVESAWVSLRVLREAEHRGCRWISPEDRREILLEGAPPEVRGATERFQVRRATRHRLAKRAGCSQP
jgi:hypothetical protein